MTTPGIKRSKLYQDRFSDEQMLEAFGTLTPGVSERTAHFFGLWMEWRKHRVKLKRNSVPVVRKMLCETGLKEMWEFQLREGEVRFCDADIMAMAMMYGLNEYKETRYV